MSPVFSLPGGGQAAPGPVETTSSLKHIKPDWSSFVPGHGLEKVIVMQKTRETEKSEWRSTEGVQRRGEEVCEEGRV